MSQLADNGEVRLSITRVFNAPIEQVYQAWIDPEQLRLWFAANHRWKRPIVDIDPRPGGRHHITMRHTDGDVIEKIGQYLEVIPNERIAFTWRLSGSVMDTEETRVIVEFRAVPEGTEITLTHDRITDQTSRAGFAEGWNGCFAVFAEYLQGITLND